MVINRVGLFTKDLLGQSKGSPVPVDNFDIERKFLQKVIILIKRMLAKTKRGIGPSKRSYKTISPSEMKI